MQTILKERAPSKVNPRRVASRYLLSGIVKCSYCGKALIGQEAKSGQFAYFVYGTLLKKGPGSCQAHYLNSHKFENQVVDRIKEHILTEEDLKELIRLINEEIDGAASEYQDQLNSVLDGIADTNRRLERLYDVLETGKPKLEDLAPGIQQLRQKLAELQARKWEI